MNSPTLNTDIKKTEAQLRAEVEAIRVEADQLKEKRIRILSELDYAKKEREVLESELQAEFQTTDIAVIEALIEERYLNNLKVIAQYRKEVDTVKGEITEVTQEMAKAV